MKYFVDAEAREAAGHENYIEFQLPTATDEFWYKASLYMLEATMSESGFGEFWSDCMHDDIIFDNKNTRNCATCAYWLGQRYPH